MVSRDIFYRFFIPKFACITFYANHVYFYLFIILFFIRSKDVHLQDFPTSVCLHYTHNHPLTATKKRPRSFKEDIHPKSDLTEAIIEIESKKNIVTIQDETDGTGQEFNSNLKNIVELCNYPLNSSKFSKNFVSLKTNGAIQSALSKFRKCESFASQGKTCVVSSKWVWIKPKPTA